MSQYLISLVEMSKVSSPSEERAFHNCCEPLLEHLGAWRSLPRSFQSASVLSTSTFTQNPSGCFPARWYLHLFVTTKQKGNLVLLHIHRGLKKKEKKMCADAVRIMQSDKRSVFLLAVSWNNPSLNKTED